jgi:peroxin-7
MKDHIGEAFSVSWNNTMNNLVTSAGMDSTVKIYDLQKGVCFQTLVGHKGVSYNSTWHPTVNNILASASADRTVKIWDMKAGKCIKTIIAGANGAEVLHCDFNKYENIIATAGSDGTLNVFDLKGTGDVPMLSMKSHMLSARRVMFSPFFPSIMASVGYDMNVVVWDIKKSAPVSTFKHHREFIIGLDFSVFNNKKIATCSWDRTLCLYDFDQQF